MKIPATMVTQHPDSATKYTPIQDEPDEGVDAVTPEEEGGLGSEEYMVDYEGKMTPYHQVTQTVMDILEKTDQIPGKDALITPRIPSATEETVFRQLMTLMSIMEANYQASHQINNIPVFEVIHPMTAEASELIEVKKRFKFVSELSKEEFDLPESFNFHLIPLIEEVPELMDIGNILGKYIDSCRNELDVEVNRLRVMLGRSDPALSYGLLPAILSVKTSIAKCAKLSKEKEVNVAPIYGGGALPFRGHVMPGNTNNIIEEFAGIQTVTIQSGIRYDIGKEKTRDVINEFKENIDSVKPLSYTKSELKEIKNLIGVFTKYYLRTFYQVIEVVKKISDFMPNQRDRLARKGPVGYARDVPMPSNIAKLTTEKELSQQLRDLQMDRLPELPRAIKFTAALYTLGIPPEFIGTGRGLEEVKKKFGEESLDRLLNYYYPSLKSDLNFAGRFVNLNLAEDLLPKRAVREVDDDIKYCMQHMDINIGPKGNEDERYMNLMETIKPVIQQTYSDNGVLLSEESEKKLLENGIKEMGKIRGSLG